MTEKRTVMVYIVREGNGVPRVEQLEATVEQLEATGGPKSYTVAGTPRARIRLDKEQMYHWGRWFLTLDEAWADFRRDLEVGITQAEATIAKNRLLLEQCPKP